jgi:hypothetical protein
MKKNFKTKEKKEEKYYITVDKHYYENQGEDPIGDDACVYSTKEGAEHEMGEDDLLLEVKLIKKYKIGGLVEIE